MDILENARLSVNGTLEVCVHKLENQVEIFIVVSSMHVEQFHDIWMVLKGLEEHNFSKSSLSISLKGVEMERAHDS